MLKWNFCPEGFIASFRFNDNANRKWIMLFVRKYTPSSLLAVVQSPLECFCVELDLCRTKGSSAAPIVFIRQKSKSQNGCFKEIKHVKMVLSE